MSRPTPRLIPLSELVDAAERAVREGRFEVARGLVEDALSRAPRDPAVRQLACLIAMAAQDMTTAAADAARWMALAPGNLNAAATLARLADTYEIEDVGALDPRGLTLALGLDGVSHAGIARLALRRAIDLDPLMLSHLDLPPAELERVGREMAQGRRLPNAVTSDLFRLALAAHVLTDHAIERLLTGFRAGLLLDAGRDGLADRDRFDLALTMLSQLWLNDHAWAETAAEREALSRLVADGERLAGGDLDAARTTLLRQLYIPLQAESGPPLTSAIARAVRPKAYGQLLARRLVADEQERAIAVTLPRLGEVTDATSERVREQYEKAPYPRWTTLALPQPGSLLAYLRRLPGLPHPAILDGPLEVLIAGCGTGQHAIRSAHGYGGHARIAALDLSRPSLAYAAQRARTLGVEGVEWMQGDLLDAARLGRPFHVIECVGVLHHMADPLAGWRRLADLLVPGGIMLIGLYSKTARQAVNAARLDPASPGAGCDDHAARLWRRVLLDRPDDAVTSSLRRSRNFNALAEFRDLVLHVSEQQVTLQEIADFLATEQLRFLGFTLPEPVLAEFASRYRDHPSPGRLEDWAEFEADAPSTFEGMYCFWCART